MAHLGQDLVLLALEGFNALLVFFGGIAQTRLRVGRQRRGGAARGGFATPGQRGLGNGLGLGWVGAFVGFGVDQNDFEGRVLEHAVEAFGVNKTHRQQGRMHGHRERQRQVQRA